MENEKLSFEEKDVGEVYLSEVKSENIREAAESFFALAEEVVEGNRFYDLILSDDTSGRLVSLYIKKILDKVQKNKGENGPDIRFIATPSEKDSFFDDEIIKMLRKLDPTRVLVVTEYIESGKTILKYVDLLTSLNLRFDLATLSICTNELIPDFKSKCPSDTGIYSGGDSGSGLLLYSRPDLVGVYKDSVSPFPVKPKFNLIDEKFAVEAQIEVNQAREDIDILAREALRRFGVR